MQRKQTYLSLYNQRIRIVLDRREVSISTSDWTYIRGLNIEISTNLDVSSAKPSTGIAPLDYVRLSDLLLQRIKCVYYKCSTLNGIKVCFDGVLGSQVSY